MIGIPGTKHISKHKFGFQIERKINGKYYYFGIGSTLIIALMKKDWVVANNWKKRYPANYTYIFKRENGKFQIVKRLNGRTENFGIFKTLEEAKSEVELLKQCNWDLDALCESFDETENGVIPVPNIRLGSTFQKSKQRNDFFVGKNGGII